MNYSIPFGIKLKIQYVTEYILICGIPKTMILKVLEIDTKIPIHRHRDTSEAVIILRGKVREVYFDNQGNEIASYLLEYGSPIPGICVPKGM